MGPFLFYNAKAFYSFFAEIYMEFHELLLLLKEIPFNFAQGKSGQDIKAEMGNNK